MELTFWKYEGTGNDFVILDGRGYEAEIPGDIIRYLCNRHRGIGADGLMILCNAEGYDFRMKYYNSDGGEVDMCGNGGRCISLFADHLGIGIDEKVFIGRDGEHRSRIISREGEGAEIELGMIDVDSYEYSENELSLNTGVPHVVKFVDELEEVDVIGQGRSIRNAERFAAAGGTNVNFVEIDGFGQIKVRTYERGVEGETLACGTGAVAAAIAAHIFAQPDCNAYTVDTAGGELDVRFQFEEGHFKNIKLSGSARRVFTGKIKIKY